MEWLKRSWYDDLTLNIYQDYESYYFRGYPRGNLVKLFCAVLVLWNMEGLFTIKFKKLTGLDQDETHLEIETLWKLTSDLDDVFDSLNQNDTLILFREVKDFLVALTPRGFLTWLGIRKTTGSKDVWPPPLTSVFDHFNRRYTVLSAKQLEDNFNPPKLTVGARALSKHAHRSTEGFWGKVTGLSEEERNKNAFEKLNEIINNWVWINIHGLPHDIVIIEWRIMEGYGWRWTSDQEFRGFIEPQITDGHVKKWRH